MKALSEAERTAAVLHTAEMIKVFPIADSINSIMHMVSAEINTMNCGEKVLMPKQSLTEASNLESTLNSFYTC